MWWWWWWWRRRCGWPPLATVRRTTSTTSSVSSPEQRSRSRCLRLTLTSHSRSVDEVQLDAKEEGEHEVSNGVHVDVVVVEHDVDDVDDEHGLLLKKLVVPMEEPNEVERPNESLVKLLHGEMSLHRSRCRQRHGSQPHESHRPHLWRHRHGSHRHRSHRPQSRLHRHGSWPHRSHRPRKRWQRHGLW